MLNCCSIWRALESQNMRALNMRSQIKLYLIICCLCTLPQSSGHPWSFKYEFNGLSPSEKLPFISKQWTSDSNNEKMSSILTELYELLQSGSQKHVQDVYKRFLFHYSKVKDSRHQPKPGAFALHPLMHLAPKLTDRKKKQFKEQCLKTISFERGDT
ncbi:neuromedin-S isoform X1 [Erpetoichthys calabaricus]|uniref:neuromedin-S isoform X1 n=1 Tax=Erpetoichthys calabaricus TaxID=27687 RepID=UPI002234ADEB|nr:neuromedin-S isoform X1 [Erpetoichthys calabaricus]